MAKIEAKAKAKVEIKMEIVWKAKVKAKIEIERKAKAKAKIEIERKAKAKAKVKTKQRRLSTLPLLVSLPTRCLSYDSTIQQFNSSTMALSQIIFISLLLIVVILQFTIKDKRPPIKPAIFYIQLVATIIVIGLVWFSSSTTTMIYKIGLTVLFASAMFRSVQRFRRGQG